jgi:hypothetical protein
VFDKLQILQQTAPTDPMVTLDASASYDPDGDPLTFEWRQLLDDYDNAPVIGTGPTITLAMPAGMHCIRLIVTDGTDEVWSYAGVGIAPPYTRFPDVPGPGYPEEMDDGHWAYWNVEACVDADVVRGYPDGLYRPTKVVTRDQMAVYISRALAGGDIPDGPATPTFPDVPTDYWAYKNIEYAAANNVVQGYGDGSYQPTWAVTRGQMAVFVARAVATPTGEAGLADYVPPEAPTFSDVDPGFWSYVHIEYLAENDIVSGYPDGSYRPFARVTRDQMAVYVARAFGLST